jgi:hypothetical protein
MVIMGYLVSSENNKDLEKFFYINMVFQIVWFILIAVIPALRTNTMRFVDMAWP